MSAALAFAVFSLTTGLLWGLPPFGHHSDRLNLGYVSFEELERELFEQRACLDPGELQLVTCVICQVELDRR